MQLQTLLGHCLPDSAPVSYPLINWSIDYMELPASFFHLKIPSQFRGHFSFLPSSNNSIRILNNVNFRFYRPSYGNPP